MQENKQSTSFSLIADMLKEIGEEDLFDDSELLELAEVCFAIL